MTNIEQLQAITRELNQKDLALKKSEEQLRRITNNIMDSISEVNQLGIYTYISPSYTKTFGYSLEEIKGESAFSLVHPDDTKRIQKIFTDAIENRIDTLEYEVRLRHKKGHYIPVEVHAQATRDNEGNLTGCILASRDITEKKKMENKIQQQERIYERIVEDQTELICRLLPEGILTFVNQAFANYFNASKELFIGAHIDEFIIPEDQEKIHKIFSDLTVINQIKVIRFRVKVDNSVRWLEWTCRLLFDDHNEPFLIQVSGRDITEQIRLEEITNKRCQILQTISENMEAMLWIKDLESKYIFASKLLCKRILNCEPEQAVGKTDKNFINDTVDVGSITDEITAQERKPTRFYEIFQIDGEEIWLDVKKTPLYTMGKVLVGTVGIAFDITKDGKDIKPGLPYRIERNLIKEIIPNKVYQLKRV